MGFLFAVIGFIVNATLSSCDIEINMWQYWVIVACVIASIVLTGILSK